MHDNTIFLGGGISYNYVALTKSGVDLWLELAGTDKITLKNCYAATPVHGVTHDTSLDGIAANVYHGYISDNTGVTR